MNGSSSYILPTFHFHVDERVGIYNNIYNSTNNFHSRFYFFFHNLNLKKVKNIKS